jgi:hypothetical protein
VDANPAAPEARPSPPTGDDGTVATLAEPSPPEASSGPPGNLTLPGARGPRKPARYGLGIQFESREGSAELGRLIESTVWVNEAHAAYRRAVASRSEGYHLALTVALALAPLAVDAANEHGFVTTFLERWGEALEAGGKRRKH